MNIIDWMAIIILALILAVVAVNFLPGFLARFGVHMESFEEWKRKRAIERWENDE